MSDKLKAADGFKEIIRLLESSDFDLNIGDAISVCYAHLAAYEAAPAEAVGDVRILINALKEISLNEDRENLDGDPAEAALEQCNAMAEEALEDYEKSKEKTP